MAPASAPERSAATAAAAAPAKALDAPPEALEPTESDALVAPAVEPPTAGATAPTAPGPPAAGAPAAPTSRAALAIVFWLAMSCVQILFNKALFSGPFRYPVTLTAVHMAFASVATWTLRAAGVITAPELPGGWSFYVQKFGLIALLFSTTLAAGNVAAARLSVSFVHILKALMPVATLFVGIVAGVNKPCYKLMCIVSVISAGVVIASMGELNWDALGFTLQMAAVLSESTRLVAMQLLLHKHMPKASPLVLLSFFAPLAAVCLTTLSLYAEPGGFPAIPAVAPLVALNTVRHGTDASGRLFPCALWAGAVRRVQAERGQVVALGDCPQHCMEPADARHLRGCAARGASVARGEGECLAGARWRSLMTSACFCYRHCWCATSVGGTTAVDWTFAGAREHPLITSRFSS